VEKLLDENYSVVRLAFNFQKKDVVICRTWHKIIKMVQDGGKKTGNRMHLFIDSFMTLCNIHLHATLTFLGTVLQRIKAVE